MRSTRLLECLPALTYNRCGVRTLKYLVCLHNPNAVFTTATTRPSSAPLPRSPAPVVVFKPV